MKKTHGFSVAADAEARRLYRIWANMVQRCTNTNNPRYADYGARGITVCKRWRKFENFLADMGMPPFGQTLDRKNNNRGYSKANCRWTDAFVQARNSRRAVNITINGVRRCISEWCTATGISYGLYKARTKRGWPQKKALSTPPANRGLRALRGKKLDIEEE